MIILAVAIGGLVAASASSYQLSRSNQARSAAHEAARQVVEQLRSADATQVYALYNEDPADDPAGAGTAPGPGFSVDSLNVLGDDDDGLVGRIFFPVDEGSVLRESVAYSPLDMPRDLNLDGVIDGNDRSGDYVLLPVGVELDWRGGKTTGHYEVHILLMAIR